MDHPIAELRPGEVIESITGAVAYDDVFGIDGAEFGDRLSDVVVIERRHDVKPADDGEHLSMPEADIAARTVLMTPRWLQDVSTTRPRPLTLYTVAIS